MEALNIVAKTPRPYQVGIIERVYAKLCDGSKVLLGMCTGSGKTFVTYFLIREFLQENSAFKVLVLAHNQAVLRDNFHSEDLVASYKLDSKGGVNSRAYSEARLVITLPATINKLTKDELGHYDMIVVDEAHEYFGGKMVQRIIGFYPNAKLLALTASHGKFSSKPATAKSKHPWLHGWHKELFSVMEGLESGVLADISMETVSTNWSFTDEDFNAEEDLSKKYEFTKDNFQNACERLDDRLRAATGKDSEMYNRLKNLPSLGRSYPKTMIAAHSKEMADHMYDFFRKKMGDGVVISYSDGTDAKNFDKDSQQLARFKTSQDCRMLIVIRRGVLGFDVPELEYMVDASGTKSVDRTTQSAGRTMRKHGSTKKIFLKITPENMIPYTRAQMATVVALFFKENYEKWTGNWKTCDIPIFVKRAERQPAQQSSNSSTKDTKKKTVEIPEDFILNTIEYGKVFEQLNGKLGAALQGVEWTSLRKIRDQMNGEDSEQGKRSIRDFWTKHGSFPRQHVVDREESRLGMSLVYYCKSDPAFDLWARSHGYGPTRHSYETIKQEAAKFTSPIEWQRANCGAQQWLSKRNLWTVLKSELWPEYIYNNKWTKEKCLSEAKKYSNRTEWHKNSGSSVRKAIDSGWYEECCAHMIWLETSQVVKDDIVIYRSGVLAAKTTGALNSKISLCCTGKRQTAAGHTWRYATPEEVVLLGDKDWIELPKK